MVQSRKAKTYKFRYDKLVRDRIPEIIKREGWLVRRKTLGKAAFSDELKKKLLEEIRELDAAKTRVEVAEELSDLLEIVDALAESYGIGTAELARVRRKKRLKIGAYERRQYINHVVYRPGADQTWLRYHLKDRKKYPLIK